MTSTVKNITVADHAIGSDERVFIIAEAGVNHDGCTQQASDLVRAAKQAGADAVKFQMFDADELASSSAPAAAYQQKIGARSQKRMLERLQLDLHEMRDIVACCQEAKIVFLATPFGVADVENLAALNVPCVKIASTDINNRQLLKAAAELHVPLIVSTGAADEHEVRTAVDWLHAFAAADHTILLHCISQYPTPIHDANLRAIGALRDAFHLPVGFSDHTTSTQIGGLAVAAGACVLEKHMTLDRTAIGPDHAMSLEPEELASYIAIVRETERILGKSHFDMMPCEADVRRVARKSVVTRRLLKTGDVITQDALTIKRPGTGIPPAE
ncbi:MAG: N-acetylneuraminate synthase family protein, partial [Phycisphaerae bacterium]